MPSPLVVAYVTGLLTGMAIGGAGGFMAAQKYWARYYRERTEALLRDLKWK